MIGVNIFGVNILFGVRMFRLRCLIFSSFGATFVRLGTFILQAHFHPRLECFLGRPTRPLLTDFKEHIAIPPFAIGKQGQIIGLLDDLGQGCHRLFE